MTSGREGRVAAIQDCVAGFSLAWLAVANLIGLWLAILLLWPELGAALGDFGYGRWMPLHMDWQLYGWCALPSLGLIAVRFWQYEENAGELCSRAFWIWSSALLVGGVSWLLGNAVGKPFLNWSGFARIYFAAALTVVWFMVARSFVSRLRRSEGGGIALWVDVVMTLGLAGVPVALYLVSDARVYPPVNPHSGGATGHSLLLSTLGIVVLMGVLPAWVLGLKRKRRGGRDWAMLGFWALFLVSLVAYLSIQHGDASNRDFDQVFGLGSLMLWPGAVFFLWQGYDWGRTSALWRGMFFFWWTALALSGWLTFLPQILDTIKFSNGMVAHAHLAMAGMVTSLNMVILLEMGGSKRVAAAVSGRGLVWLWNSSLLLFVVALGVQGLREGQRPDVLFLFDEGSRLAYQLRLFAGLGMLASSVVWVVKFWIQRK